LYLRNAWQLLAREGLMGKWIAKRSSPCSLPHCFSAVLTILGPGPDQLILNGYDAARVLSISGSATHVTLNGLSIVHESFLYELL
jgi:hypothetical protein